MSEEKKATGKQVEAYKKALEKHNGIIFDYKPSEMANKVEEFSRLSMHEASDNLESIYFEVEQKKAEKDMKRDLKNNTMEPSEPQKAYFTKLVKQTQPGGSDLQLEKMQKAFENNTQSQAAKVIDYLKEARNLQRSKETLRAHGIDLEEQIYPQANKQEQSQAKTSNLPEKKQPKAASKQASYSY